ncbi:PREDICTED: sec-independent protein translocase protein TATA, chloroplastic-like [Lupinus angustifolius]|uniref:sec-independent protein translocase protein TATA, chloroplastic-like n=1 Tax=Lupinus angustifolius TaxID=3871 RepID=UPI00092EB527|nr:PREDICTED: sec-independent protein translocase protein TATA, chloroplastic-like [Lupinus angustifolius]
MEMITASLTLPLHSPSSIPQKLHFSSSSLSFSATNTNLFLKSENMSIITRRSRIQNARTKSLVCNALFGLGVPELAVIAGVAALVFGPKNLPQVGRSFGKTIKSFQQAAKEFESEIKKEPSSTDEPIAEELTAVNEQQEQNTKVSSTKDNA